MEKAAILDALGKTHIFRGIAPKGLETVAAIAREKSFRRGEHVFKEGDTGTELYLILDGKVRISRDVAGMGEEALTILSVGDAFGEMSLIDDAPRSADAIVHETCRLLVIEKDALEDMMFLHKEIAYELLWNIVRVLSQRLRETNDKMAFLSVSGKF